MKTLAAQLAEAQAEYTAAIAKCKAGRSIDVAVALRKLRDIRHRMIRHENRRRKAA